MNTLPQSAAVCSVAMLFCASAVCAQHSRIDFDVSSDYGVTWHDEVSVWPGQQVHVRMRILLIGEPDPPVLGLVGLTCQPTLSPWMPLAGDRPVPFTFPGFDSWCAPTSETAYEGRHVGDIVSYTGRSLPFGSSQQGPASSSGLLTSHIDAGVTLRFAGSKNTSPTRNPAWGVALMQNPPVVGGTNFTASADLTAFRFAVTLGPRTTAARSMVAGVPLGLVSGGVVKWFRDVNGFDILNDPLLAANIAPAAINVRARCQADIAGTTIPAPPGSTPSPLTGFPDGAVDAEDLALFMQVFDAGVLTADLDDGSNTGTPDGGVTIDDLLFFLARFEQGC